MEIYTRTIGWIYKNDDHHIRFENGTCMEVPSGKGESKTRNVVGHSLFHFPAVARAVPIASAFQYLLQF